MDRLKKILKDAPVFKLCFSAGIILFFLAMLYNNYHYLSNNDAISAEMIKARSICEHARGKVLPNLSKFAEYKMKLQDLDPNQPPTKFDFVPYPKVVFYDGVFHKFKSMKHDNIYCEVIDPRSRSTRFYYRFKTGLWVDDKPYHP